MRFVHTADVHLGRKFEQFGEKGELRRGDLRKAFSNVVDLALSCSAQLLLISGDLFDSNRPPQADLELLHKELGRLASGGIRAFIAPGNHDPYVRGCLWEREFSGALGIHHIFSSAEFHEVVIEDSGCSVIGCSYDVAAPNRRPLAQLSLKPSGKKSILMVHGSLEVPGQEFSDQPISRQEIIAAPFNYIALGHFHAFREVVREQRKASFYPGCPEGLSLDETGSGPRYALVGEIADDGSVTIEPRQVGSKLIEVLELDCAKYLEASALESEIRKRCSPDVILRVNLRGLPPFDLLEAINAERLKERFANSFYFLRIDNGELGAPEDIPRDGRFAIGRAVNKLIEKMESCDDAEERGIWRAALDQLLGAMSEAKRG